MYLTTTRTNPFSQLYTVDWMDQLLGTTSDSHEEWGAEDESNFYYQIDLPGVSKGDVEISTHKRKLTLKWSRTRKGAKEPDRYSSTCWIPANSDISKSSAELKDGVLCLTIPKLTRDQKEQKIVVK